MGHPARLRRFRAVGLLLLRVALLTPVLSAQIVRAATVAVTMNDANSGGNSDVVHSPGYASDGTTAPCSLRDAVTYANANAGTTISVPAGTYTLTHADTSDTASGLVLSASMTITGAGASSSIIQANAAANTATYRVLSVSGADVTVSGVTIQHGNVAGGFGGGIYNDGGGTATMTNSTLSGNSASGVGGGTRATDNGNERGQRKPTCQQANRKQHGGGGLQSATGTDCGRLKSATTGVFASRPA